MRVRAEADSDAGQQVLQTSRALLGDLFGPSAERPFAVQFWNGSADEPQPRNPAYRLVLKRPGALRRMFLPPSELALGEAYLRDDFDIVGHLEDAAEIVERAALQMRSPLVMARVARRALSLPREPRPAEPADRRAPLNLKGMRHSRQRDALAVRFHYDVGNAFYALWLDQRMVYSCAYFETGDEDIDEAQGAKLDYVCRKLALRRGERLLDIGCGWGGLLIHAAEHYGVEGVGITLSAPQAKYARERIAAAGLTDRCRVEVADYRDLARGAAFDKVVSVGMIEHVGRTQLAAYFARAYQATKPGGLFLNHGVVRPPARRKHARWAALGRLIWRPGSFNERYVFPDGELPSTGEVIASGEAAGFEARDLENLREHYVLTARHWVRRLEAQHDRALQIVSEPTYRVWRAYLSASGRALRNGEVAVVQALFSRPATNGWCGLPMTRAGLYAPRPTSSSDRNTDPRIASGLSSTY